MSAHNRETGRHVISYHLVTYNCRGHKVNRFVLPREAALIDAMRTEEALKIGRVGLGEQLAQLFLNTHLEITQPSMIALSLNDPDAREILVHVIEEYALAPLAKWLGPTDARARALEIILLATGFVLYTRQLPELFAKRGVDKKLAKWFAQSVQAIVDQS